MFRVVCLLVLLLLTVGNLAAEPTNGAVKLSDAQMADVVGQGWCGFFNGLSAGLGASAIAASFVPGGQGFAAGAGAVAGFMKLGVVVIC